MRVFIHHGRNADYKTAWLRLNIIGVSIITKSSIWPVR